MGLFKVLSDLTAGLDVPVEPQVAPTASAMATQPLDPTGVAATLSPAALAALRERLFRCVEKALGDRVDREPFISALFTLAVAVAFIDGEIVEAERREMDGFLAVAARSGFSASRLARFREMYDTPPTCEEALAHIEQIGVEPALVSDLVQLLVDADGKVTIEEFELLARLSIERDPV